MNAIQLRLQIQVCPIFSAKNLDTMLGCNCPPGLNCETLPCLTPPCPTRCVNPGGIPPVNGGTQFNGQGQPGFPQTQFRQPGQFDQSGQVQQPGLQGFGANGNPNQMSYGPNPFLPNNIAPGQSLNTGNSVRNSNAQ